MSSTRTWAIGAAVASILLVVASWFLLIGPKRSEAGALNSQRVTQLRANDQLRLDIQQLKAQFATLPAKQAELAVIQRQMPNNPALPSLIRSLTTIATASGVTLNTIAPGAPVAVTATATTGTAGSTTAAAPTTGAAPLVAIPLSITVTGTYAENELFLQKLQTAVTRALLVQGIQITVASGTGTSASGSTTTTTTTTTTSATPDLQTTITGSVFVLSTAPTASASSGTAAGTASTATGSAS